MTTNKQNAGPRAALLALALASVLSDSAAAQTGHFAIVDAGSTGSRLHLYALERGGNGVEIRDLLDVSGNAPGLSTFAGEPQAAGPRGMGQLISALDARVKELGLSKERIELHVLGTAGMRLIGAENARAIYDNVGSTFSAAGYRPKHVGTITGQMEAFYAWADANFLLGSFTPSRATVGMIEIGGASMQVAYAVEQANQPDVTKGRIFGRDHHVRTSSFLGLGVNESRRSMMHAQDKGASCYPAGAPVESVPEPRFDAQACRQAYIGLVATHRMDEIAARPEFRNQSFVGLGRPMSGSLSLWKTGSTSPAALGAKAAQECPRGWNHIAVTYGAGALMRDLCANSIYMDVLLFDAAGLRMSADRIATHERLGNRVPNWPRGVVVTLAE